MSTLSRIARRTLAALTLSAALASPALAQPCGVPVLFQTLPGITGSQVAIDFDPTDPARLIALDINGTVRAYNTAASSASTILALTGSGSSNAGYGLAVDPLYATTGHVYIFFPTGSNSSVLRYTRSASNPATLDSTSRTVILQIPNTPTQHTGGWLGFGPDGFLYIGVGDHFNDANAQNTAVLMGKILRIDIRSDGFPADANKNYAIPPTNPFIGTTSPPEVVCRGVRNPFRCAFDPPTGALFIADVGSSLHEEVNRFLPAAGLGQNFGWPCREGLSAGFGSGAACANPALFTNPIMDFTRAQLSCITGGVVYHGAAIPGLAGRYLAGSCSTAALYSFLPSNPFGSLRKHTGPTNSAYCFAATAQGEIYVGLANGLARIIPAAPPTADCNHNAIPDTCEISGGLETDFNTNTIPDSCERTCPADFNASHALDTQDIFDFISTWFAAKLAADFNASGGLDVQDLFDYLNAWFAGCH
jgi:glucose/arabinose dehydrogenase